MPVTASFLDTCRTAIYALPERAAFLASLATASGASRPARAAAWLRTFGDNQAGGSPAYRLRKAIRDVVQAQADTAGTLSPLDRESAYRTLVAEQGTHARQPASDAVENAEFQRLALQELLS